jgi:hypothetical protein
LIQNRRAHQAPCQAHTRLSSHTDTGPQLAACACMQTETPFSPLTQCRQLHVPLNACAFTTRGEASHTDEEEQTNPNGNQQDMSALSSADVASVPCSMPFHCPQNLTAVVDHLNLLMKLLTAKIPQSLTGASRTSLSCRLLSSPRPMWPWPSSVRPCVTTGRCIHSWLDL